MPDVVEKVDRSRSHGTSLVRFSSLNRAIAIPGHARCVRLIWQIEFDNRPALDHRRCPARCIPGQVFDSIGLVPALVTERTDVSLTRPVP
jgi:hypothetical protein